MAKIDVPVRVFIAHAPASRLFRWTALLGTWALVATLALLAMCCAPNLSRIPERIEQQSRAVELRVLCGSFGNMLEQQSGIVKMGFAAGSGVIVGPHRILTAAHVPACDDGQVGIAWARLGATVVDRGTWVPVTVDRYYTPERDIASLYVKQNTGFGPIAFRDSAVREHESVCAAFAHPMPRYVCGPFKKYIDAKQGFNGVLGIAVVSGNSGSGVFDRQGRLVGIIAAQELCHLEVTINTTPIPDFINGGNSGDVMHVPELRMVGGPDCSGFAAMLDGKVKP